MSCPFCGEALYRCVNCVHYTTRGFDDEVYINQTNYVGWCNVFDTRAQSIREGLGDIRCPRFELLKNVNFCKACGRSLRP